MKLKAYIIATLTCVLSITGCEGTLDIASLIGQGGSTTTDSSIGVELQSSTVTYEKSSLFVYVTAAGEWTLALNYPQAEESWASLAKDSGSGSKDVIMSYALNPTDSTRHVDIVLTCGGKTATCTLYQSASSAMGGSTENKGVSSTTCGWMELPATSDNDGLDWFHTDMTGPAGTTMRNYSYYWDYDNLVSHWVAYPLNKTLQGPTNLRPDTDVWNADPNLPNSQQSIISNGGFRPSGLDRGHQCPSRDRCFSADANLQTFRGTNATPQLSGFNQTIWSSFENLVRTWSNGCDTLYVVTGCVVAANSTSGGYGEVGGYATDNNGKRVAIPTAYWKAVLRYKKTPDYGYSGYCGCAVWLEHKGYSEDASVTKAMSMSIDDLEKKTGLDLFVNLPKAIGEGYAAKVEAQNPQDVQVWW